MLFLTSEQHQEVVRRLLDLGRSRAEKIPFHPAGMAYTSLMACFLLHELSAAETLVRISRSFGNEWFPVSVGYAVTRTMFEADVTAHYITKDPSDRALQYVNFAAVLNKRQMDACSQHRNSKDPGWRKAMALLWQHHWGPREEEVKKRFAVVTPRFTLKKSDGKDRIFQNWSGKTIRQMAAEVDHLEAYDIFYSELSSFTHVDVHLADRFLKNRSDGPVWSQRAEEADVGNVFRHAATFLTCYLDLFGHTFGTWTESTTQDCWRFPVN